MPKRSLPAVRATPTGARRHPVRATRAALVAATSAAAAVLALLPVDAPAPADVAPRAVPALAVGPASPAVRAATLPVPAAPAPTAPATTAPVVGAPVATVAAQTMTATPTAAAGRGSVVALALDKVGSPYRWGATGPSSFDCSGLVNWAFRQVGVDVPRTSRDLSRTGAPVARGDLRPGDLVFFYSPVSHVGIYVGDGQMVHASTSGKPVTVASLDGRPYHSARRI